MDIMNLINNTVHPDGLNLDEIGALYNPIQDAIIDIMPKKLYRFRSCSERSLSALWRDQLWFSNGSTMNDDFDARLYYNNDRIEAWLNNFKERDSDLSELINYNNMDAMSELFKNITPGSSEIFISTLKELSKEKIEEAFNFTLKTVSDNIGRYLSDITEEVQSFTKFACFTESIDNSLMWGHYADNSTGFALEYSFDNCLMLRKFAGKDIWLNLFPILYGNKRIDATEYVLYLFKHKFLKSVLCQNGLNYSQQWISNIVKCPDNFMVTKLAINKYSGWNYEKEWRMFYVSNASEKAQEPHSFIHYAPSAVYLGRKISQLNEKIIRDIAKEKEIPVYKMKIDDAEGTYKMSGELV